jgi:hypothetical protein
MSSSPDQSSERTSFLHAGFPVKELLTMGKGMRTLRVVLLVALALCVGGPPSLFALERTPEIAVATNGGPGQTPPQPGQPQLVMDNGDPDDWASRSDEDEDEMVAGGSVATLYTPSGSKATWRDYLEYISGLLIRIKLRLTGIL